jgi:hypothetical protein
MQYIEELKPGDCFLKDENFFILTNDFKKNGDKFCIDLKTGHNRWVNRNEIVNTIDIFTIDKDNNIIAIRERVKDNTNAISENV